MKTKEMSQSDSYVINNIDLKRTFANVVKRVAQIKNFQSTTRSKKHLWNHFWH